MSPTMAPKVNKGKGVTSFNPWKQEVKGNSRGTNGGCKHSTTTTKALWTSLGHGSWAAFEKSFSNDDATYEKQARVDSDLEFDDGDDSEMG
ncbi:hypothetical protein HAX54_037219 [Datura stramonium]|uniref:Uncharacterized protein n=1 Tax=Datura stramonium TaxID=4076 RepID=A0ABS8VJQ7_DATST|nr:hypothetical protein [Datura stramonium]